MDLDFCFQEIIDNYIVDFLHPEMSLIIECDGHDWHSTPQQKYKDSVRDQDLKRKGYAVLHLLGWQCWNEPVCKGLIKDFVDAQKGLNEPMGAGERVSSVTVESPSREQENTLSLSRD